MVQSGCAKGARIIVEKPFGHDLASAQELDRILLSNFPESAIFRFDHYLAKGPSATCSPFASRAPSSSRSGMAGDATLFARQDYVDEAWRTVHPVLKAATPVYIYEPQTWGPKEVDQAVLPPGGWDQPQQDEPEDFRIVKAPA